MAIFAFVISAILFACGLLSFGASVNLVPTEMGLLYAVCGAIFVSASGVAATVAAMIARLDRIVAPPRRRKPDAEAALPEAALPEAPLPEETPPSGPAALGEASPPVAEPGADDEINLNRRGRLPSLSAIEEAIIEPEARPDVVGRYTQGGAKYMIFSDGSIEAETDEGALRFTSLREFRSYIAQRKS